MVTLSHHVPMDPPKFLFLPARPLVCGLALFGIVRSFVQFWMADSSSVEFSHLCVFFLDILLLFGAWKNDVIALKWSQRVVLVCVIIAILRFLIYPVVFASFIASGLASNHSDFTENDLEIIANITTPEQHFVFGLVSGYTLEFATGLSIGDTSPNDAHAGLATTVHKRSR
uniref:Uncharacterized protein n=1 Tax=Caenorhabditis japonica TaxID=281687 RepID=A0A8R1IPB3_CAEJA